MAKLMTTAPEEPEWLALLRSRKRLDRERGLSQLKAVLDTECLEEDEKNRLESCIFGLFSSPAAPWEEKHGGLMAAVVMVPTASERFCDLVKGEIPLLLEHQESRIRLTAGELLAYHLLYAIPRMLGHSNLHFSFRSPPTSLLRTP